MTASKRLVLTRRAAHAKRLAEVAKMKWIMVQVLRIAAAACYMRPHEVHPCQACLGGDALRMAANDMERA